MSILSLDSRSHSDLPVRVDPAVGLLETLLVLEGRPISLRAHLDRLWRSATVLFGAPPPKALVSSIQLTAGKLTMGRLRVIVSWPGLSDPRCHVEGVEVSPDDIFPTAGEGRSLHTVAHGSLGPHKWADRAWMEDLEMPAGDSVPLLFSARARDALETTRGNIFIVKQGTLVTPALDGRILPGIVRAQTIALAREIGIAVVERPLLLNELITADEVFTTGSVRGIEPIGAIDGAVIRSGSETPRLAANLRRSWLRTKREPASGVALAAQPSRPDEA